MKSDFHIHTNYSDGVFTPERVIDAAIDANLDVIAITDHDNILAYDIAQNHIKKLEDELNCELLSRQSPIRPTSAGQQLRHYAEQMIELPQQAKFHFSDQTLCHDVP